MTGTTPIRGESAVTRQSAPFPNTGFQVPACGLPALLVLQSTLRPLLFKPAHLHSSTRRFGDLAKTHERGGPTESKAA